MEDKGRFGLKSFKGFRIYKRGIVEELVYKRDTKLVRLIKKSGLNQNSIIAEEYKYRP